MHRLQVQQRYQSQLAEAEQARLKAKAKACLAACITTLNRLCLSQTLQLFGALTIIVTALLCAQVAIVRLQAAQAAEQLEGSLNDALANSRNEAVTQLLNCSLCRMLGLV